MKKEKLKKIYEALSWGCNDNEVCHYAGISPDGFQKYVQKNKNFAREKIKLQQMPSILLKKRLFESIAEIKPETCLKILEKQEQNIDPEIDFEEILGLEKILKKS